jgi:hypothetical protein
VYEGDIRPSGSGVWSPSDWAPKTGDEVGNEKASCVDDIACPLRERASEGVKRE